MGLLRKKEDDEREKATKGRIRGERARSMEVKDREMKREAQK